MSQYDAAAPNIEPGHVLATTLRICRQQASPMLLACAIAILPFTAIDFAFAAAGAVSPTFLNFASAFANCWLYGTLAHLALPAIERRPVSFAEASSAATPMIGAIFALSLIQGLGVFVGLLLFLVPGVYFWVWGYVAVPVALFEGLRGTAAIRRSGELTRGRRLPIFVLGVLGSIVIGGAFVALVLPSVLVAVGEPDIPAASGGDYPLLLASAALQFAWAMVATVAMTVVYAELRERDAGADARALADVFS